MAQPTVNEPTQIEVTVKYRYTPNKADYATEGNMNPTLEEMIEIDRTEYATGEAPVEDLIDWDLADVEFKPVTDRP